VSPVQGRLQWKFKAFCKLLAVLCAVSNCSFLVITQNRHNQARNILKIIAGLQKALNPFPFNKVQRDCRCDSCACRAYGAATKRSLRQVGMLKVVVQEAFSFHKFILQ
jgi:hypothetical protein